MWPAVAPSRPSIWGTPFVAHPSACVVKDRPAPRPARTPTVRASTSPVRAAPSARPGDLTGVALNFGTLSQVMPLPKGTAELAGFDRAQVMFEPGAFDEALAACRVGEWESRVGFQFGHIEETRCASTMSGAVRLWADRQALRFHIDGGTRDGKSAAKWARCFKDCRELSIGATMLHCKALRGEDGEPNTLLILKAGLFEISLVPSGAFPRTSVVFH
ncbi:: Peptidase_U35 [Gemmataceae bacterium]|nr:: Peptidase_U35 [Gemmataceae bacterium]VTT99070.1 : Peptidase_U35 [Gemmataceae bacterium]